MISPIEEFQQGSWLSKAWHLPHNLRLAHYHDTITGFNHWRVEILDTKKEEWNGWNVPEEVFNLFMRFAGDQ